VKALIAMRAEHAARRARIGSVRLQMERSEPSGKLVFEAEHVSKAYGGVPVVKDFSTRVMRGDRIGLIGPNGAGKTTLLRLLLGELPPDSGEVRAGANVQVAYYDQQREQLDPERTVADTVGDGNDTVVVGGEPRHIIGYLQDFLFPPERSRSPVKALSGGERNRLLLARLFTRPANVLVLDEPTNDLDLETLELLEEQLLEWPGTLLLVSHDRRFLDNVVTSTMVFEGDGRVVEYTGGYYDWLRQKPDHSRSAPALVRPEPGLLSTAAAVRSLTPDTPGRSRSKPGPTPGPAVSSEKRKLSFKEQRELEALPGEIAALEAEHEELQARSSQPGFYKEAPSVITTVLARMSEIGDELLAAYQRWDELDSRTSPLRGP
jgi:ATP-binding cassette subfamily F protein uup